MTSRRSRRLTIVLLCLDVVVQLTVCNHNDTGAPSDHNEQPVNYRGSVIVLLRSKQLLFFAYFTQIYISAMKNEEKTLVDIILHHRLRLARFGHVEQ